MPYHRRRFVCTIGGWSARTGLALVAFGLAASPAVAGAQSGGITWTTVAKCDEVTRRLAEPIQATARPIPGRALGGVENVGEDSTRMAFAIGPFQYSGSGYYVGSRDNRFYGVRVSDQHGLHHRCGHRLESWIASPQPGAPPAAPRQATFRFTTGLDASAAMPGTFAAEKAGARPEVYGYIPVASWPIHHDGKTSYIGLMHPRRSQQETLVVRFEGQHAAARTTILARLPMRFHSISILPNLHRSGSTVTLSGKHSESDYLLVNLEMPSTLR